MFFKLLKTLGEAPELYYSTKSFNKDKIFLIIPGLNNRKIK